MKAGRSMLFLLCPRLQQPSSTFTHGVEGDYMPSQQTLFSHFYNMVVYNLEEHQMLQMINANGDGVYNYTAFPWIKENYRSHEKG